MDRKTLNEIIKLLKKYGPLFIEVIIIIFGLTKADVRYLKNNFPELFD